MGGKKILRRDIIVVYTTHTEEIMRRINFKNEIIRNCTTLLSGTAIAQCVTFLAYPVIARLFSSEDFGIYTTILSYIDIFVILSTARYEQAIMTAKSTAEISAIVKLCRILCTTVSIFIAIATGIILAFSDATKLDMLMLFIPLLVFFNGQYRIYLLLFNKYKEFKHIALSDVVSNISATGLKIGFGLLSLFKVGLPLGTTLGRIAGNINFWIRLRKIPLPKADKGMIKQMIKTHKNFPLYSMPKDFINSFSINLPFTLLAIYFDEAFIGLFSMAFTFTFRPMNIINSAYDKVLYERISTKFLNKQPFMKDILRFFGYNYLAALPLFVVVFCFAEPILTFLLGNDWGGSAAYFRYMLPWIFVMLISSSISFIPNIFSTQRTEALLYLILFLVRIGTMAIGIYLNNFNLAILLFCISGTVFTLLLTMWYMMQILKYEKELKQIAD